MYRYGAAVALLALAGCSAEHVGSLPSLPPATSVETAVATATAPADPRTAAVKSETRRYFAALTAAGRSGDLSVLASLLAAGCGCRRQLDYIRTETSQGRRITTDYRVDDVSVHDLTATTAAASVTFSAPASAVVDAHGRTVRRLDPVTRGGLELSWRRTGARWVIVRAVALGA
jgi:hypothetical protein